MRNPAGSAATAFVRGSDPGRSRRGMLERRKWPAIPLLGVLPERLHLVEAGLGRRAACGRQRFLDGREAALELDVGRAQGLVGIDLAGGGRG